MEDFKYSYLINNKTKFSNNKMFAAIIGASPSRGARSPKLWNAAFNENSIDCKMIPLDVSSNKFNQLLFELDQDRNFIGGSITIPYKEQAAKWLGSKRLTNEAISIGSINCIFRNQEGKLIGTNTDGEAALITFVKKYGNVSGKNLLILGPGGAGKAVIARFF